jgi:hypothetical protein
MFPIRDQNGRVKWIGGIAQDVTIHDGLQAYLIDADPSSRQKLARASFPARVCGQDLRLWSRFSRDGARALNWLCRPQYSFSPV